jgi:hypothetical protein
MSKILTHILHGGAVIAQAVNVETLPPKYAVGIAAAIAGLQWLMHRKDKNSTSAPAPAVPPVVSQGT